METLYYTLFKKFITKLLGSAELEKIYRKLPGLIHPVRVIEIKTPQLDRNTAYKIYSELCKIRFPFIAIEYTYDDGDYFEGKAKLRFFDIGRGYKRILSDPNIFIYDEPVHNRLPKSIMVYNYNVFGVKGINTTLGFTLEDNELQTLLNLGLDYIFGVRRYWLSKFENYVSYDLVIRFEDFIFQTPFLTHQIYDEGDKITGAFLLHFSKILKKTLSVSGPIVKGKAIEVFETQNEIIENLMENYINPVYKEKFGKLPVIPNWNSSDYKAKFKSIEKILEAIK